MKPGETLVLYTDGLLEAHAPGRTVTVQQMIERSDGRQPGSAEDTIDAAARMWSTSSSDVRDDIAVVVARVKPASRRSSLDEDLVSGSR